MSSDLHPSILAPVSLAANIAANHPKQGLCQLLEISGLSLSLGGHPILEGIDLSLDEGVLHVLLGANGAGKSSLAYCLMGCAGYKPP